MFYGSRLYSLLPSTLSRRFQGYGYERAETIDLEDLNHTDEQADVHFDRIKLEYDPFQSWLTPLMRGIQHANHFSANNLPITSKNASFYSLFASKLRKGGFNEVLWTREVGYSVFLSFILEVGSIPCFYIHLILTCGTFDRMWSFFGRSNFTPEAPERSFFYSIVYCLICCQFSGAAGW
jgi:hypothetical protein